MIIHERSEAGVTFLRPETDQIDLAKAGELKARLSEHISRGNRVLALNLSQVEFMDSSGLGVLISALRQLECKGELLLCGVQEGVVGLLRITSLVRIFSLYRTEEELLAARPD